MVLAPRPHVSAVQPVAESVLAAQVPGDEGVRRERLTTLAALRDSGALTKDEFQAEKRRILD